MNEEDVMGMAKVVSMHMYTKVEYAVFGVKVRCECGRTYGSGFEPPADLAAQHIAGALAKAGYGKVEDSLDGEDS